MARQEDACWRCGAQWTSEDVPRTTLRAIAGGQLARPAAEIARAEARLSADRWMNEGGGAGFDATSSPLRAVAARR